MALTTANPPRRFLFVGWEGGGNMPPILGLARRLVSRGHAVRVLSDPCNEAEVAASGCAFVPYARAPHRRDKARASTIITDWQARSPAKAFAVLRDRLMFGPARAYAEDVLAELTREPADVVAANDALYGAHAAAEKAGVPLAVLIPNCYMGPARGFPFAAFPPARGPLGRTRDAIVAWIFRREFAKGLPALNAARAAIGLPAIGHPWDQLLRADRVLVLTSLAFDFPAAWLPQNVRYIGPQLDDPRWAAPWAPPWPEPLREPLVLVSFSTTFQDQRALLQRIIDALRGLRVRGVVTTGPTVDPGQLRASPNVVVVESAPHARVLPHAAAVVTHAGHGTVIRALASGVPLVCVPMGRDQPDNAARVVTRGAGLRLSHRASESALRAAIRRVLEEPSFRERARQLGDVIADDARQSTAVDELERLATRAARAERDVPDAAVPRRRR